MGMVSEMRRPVNTDFRTDCDVARVTVVIPTYNERENLRTLVEKIARLNFAEQNLDGLRSPEISVLIVDDASPDGTGALAEKLTQEFPVRVLHRTHKEGLGAAYVAGFRRALADGADIIVQMDADGSHDPEEIPKMIDLISRPSFRSEARLNFQRNFGGRSEESHTNARASHIVRSLAAARDDEGKEMQHDEEEADLVIGSRRVPGGRIVGWGWHRRFMSWSAQWFARHLLGLQTRDVTSGFRAWRATMLHDILEGERAGDAEGGSPSARRLSSSTMGVRSGRTRERTASGYVFQEEMLYRAERAEARVVERPITFRDRAHGRSKLGWRDIVGYFATLVRLRRIHTAPSRADGSVSWSCLPPSERRFALWLGLALILITGLPYLFGWLRTPTGYTFTGLHGIAAGDGSVYYSYIEQVRDGHFVFRDLFTSETNGGRMIQWPWLMIGLFARIFKLSAPFVFHFVRLLLIVPFVSFLAVFVAAFLKKPIAEVSATTCRKTALLLITLAMGIGGHAAGVLLSSGRIDFSLDDIRGYSEWPLDIGTPEAFPFLAIYQSPHFIVSLWLMLAIYLFTLRADETQRVRWTVASAITAFALSTMHPFYIPAIASVLVAYAIVRTIAARRWLTRLAAHVFWTIFAMLPALIYWGLLALFDPIHISRAQQNLLLTPPLLYVLLGYGFLIPLAIVGVALLFKRHRPLGIPTVFLLVWTMTNITLLWAPVPWQRRFTQGLQPALALLTTFAFAYGYSWLRRKLPTNWRVILLTRANAITLFVLLLSFTNIVQIGRDFALYAIRFPEDYARHLFYYPSDGIAAMRWLRQNAPNDAAMLALGPTANLIPGWSSRPVYIGHTIETINFRAKSAAIQKVFDPTATTSERRDFIVQSRIRYIFATHFDQYGALLDTAARELALPVAFTNTAVTVYAVP
ncbi:MAG: glycosyltransferase [Candidatus Uhrbacteria bacterium]